MSVQDDLVSFCSFWLAGRMFGVNILDVKEIISNPVISKVNHAPKEVKGLVNIRGHIYLAADMRLIIGFEENTTNNKMIIFKNHIVDSFGIIVDDVDDIVSVPKNSITDRRKNSEGDSKFKDKRIASSSLSYGICKLKKNILITLNSKAIISQIGKNIKDMDKMDKF